MRIVIIICLVLVLAGSVQAGPFGSIQSVKSLPIQGVKMIESDKGIFFVSENGRFVWKGPLYDMWNGRPVKEMGDVEQVVNHVNLRKIGVNPDELSTLTIGTGALEEVMFISSACPHCLKMVKQATKLGEKYRFKVVLIPMGKKSMEQTRQLLCAKDQGRAVQALVTGNYDGLGAGDCPVPSLSRTLVAARVMGIRSVPYFIRHDGRVHSGEINDLAGWLVAAGRKSAGQKGGQE